MGKYNIMICDAKMSLQGKDNPKTIQTSKNRKTNIVD